MPLDSSTPIPGNVSSTHSLDDTLAFSGRLYERLSLRHTRSHHAIRLFIAALGLAVREARRDPQAVNERCRKAGVGGKRLETRLCRLIIGRRNPAKQDPVARWVNA